MMLAFVPLLDPLDLHESWWVTLVPLALGISIAYKAVRMADLARFWRDVALMTVQILLGMVAMAVGAYLLVEVIARALD